MRRSSLDNIQINFMNLNSISYSFNSNSIVSNGNPAKTQVENMKLDQTFFDNLKDSIIN